MGGPGSGRRPGKGTGSQVKNRKTFTRGRYPSTPHTIAKSHVLGKKMGLHVKKALKKQFGKYPKGF